jgi:hypothetical protein
LADALASLHGFHLRREDMDGAAAGLEKIRRATAVDESTIAQAIAGLRDCVLRRC